MVKFDNILTRRVLTEKNDFKIKKVTIINNDWMKNSQSWYNGKVGEIFFVRNIVDEEELFNFFTHRIRNVLGEKYDGLYVQVNEKSGKGEGVIRKKDCKAIK